MPRKGRKSSNKRKRNATVVEESESVTKKSLATFEKATEEDESIENDHFSSSSNEDNDALSENVSSDDGTSSSDESDYDKVENSTLSSKLEATMISNYKTIPVDVMHCTSLSSSTSSTITKKHTLHLYLRVHQSQTNNMNTATANRSKRTLFVTNFPSRACRKDFIELFQNQFGTSKIQTIQFGSLTGRAPKPEKKDGWPSIQDIDLKYSLITFKSSSDIRKIMNWVPSSNSGQNVEWVIGNGGKSNRSTVEGWIKKYQKRQPTLSSEMEKADYYMKQFVERKETLRSELDARRGIKDEDGFQLVSKKRTARSSGNARAGNRRSRSRNKKNGAGKELQDFYRFQMRENKRNKLSELRERFKEDRERVEHLRTNKKFKMAARLE
jgi:hypothetical protein